MRKINWCWWVTLVVDYLRPETWYFYILVWVSEQLQSSDWDRQVLLAIWGKTCDFQALQPITRVRDKLDTSKTYAGPCDLARLSVLRSGFPGVSQNDGRAVCTSVTPRRPLINYATVGRPCADVAVRVASTVHGKLGAAQQMSDRDSLLFLLVKERRRQLAIRRLIDTPRPLSSIDEQWRRLIFTTDVSWNRIMISLKCCSGQWSG